MAKNITWLYYKSKGQYEEISPFNNPSELEKFPTFNKSFTTVIYFPGWLENPKIARTIKDLTDGTLIY